MPQYVLRSIPEELWQRVTDRATIDCWPMRALLLQLLEDYADRRISPSVASPARKENCY